MQRELQKCRPWSDCSSRSSLIWVCTVCPDLSVCTLRTITVAVCHFSFTWKTKIKFCVKLGLMLTQTNVKMTAAHTNYKVSRKLIFKWHVRFRENIESLKDDSSSGRPVNVRWHNLAESLMDACILKQGCCPTSGSGKKIGCFLKFKNVLTDINLKSDIDLIFNNRTTGI